MNIDLRDVENLQVNFCDLIYFRSSNIKEFNLGVKYSLLVAKLFQESRVAFYGLQFSSWSFFHKNAFK